MYKVIEKNGSFTIELSLLTPLLIAILLMLLFSDYYMHDRVIIEKACNISALRSSLCVQEDKREAVLIESFNKETEGKLLGKWDYELDSYIDEEVSEIIFAGNMKMAENLLGKVINYKLFRYKTDCLSYVNNETKYLREFYRDK